MNIREYYNTPEFLIAIIFIGVICIIIMLLNPKMEKQNRYGIVKMTIMMMIVILILLWKLNIIPELF